MRLYLDPKKLQRLADEHRDAYASADPFPHVVLDGVLPDEALDELLAVFPDPDSRVWKEYENHHERKLETQGEERLGSTASLLLYQFNSAPFIAFLERLSGIDGLIPDPYFSGGGLHQIERGGKLGIHADFSRHPTLPLDRRLNCLIYLNRDWKDSYGGHLELWNRDATECRRRIAPVFNRMVIFNTTDWSWHGHPEPLQCPADVTRRSIALYYFSVGRPSGETIEGKQSTLFVQLPGESLAADVPLKRTSAFTGLKRDRYATATAAGRAKWIVRGITPPFVMDAVRRLRTRR